MSRFVEVDQAYLVMAEVHFPLPVGLRAWAQSDGQFAKGASDVPGLVLEGEEAAFARDAYLHDGGIFDRGQCRGEVAYAGAIAGGRRGALQGIVGAFAVVAVAVAGELVFAVREVAPGVLAQQFRGEGAVEAFVLALGLGGAGGVRGSPVRRGEAATQ